MKIILIAAMATLGTVPAAMAAAKTIIEPSSLQTIRKPSVSDHGQMSTSGPIQFAENEENDAHDHDHKKKDHAHDNGEAAHHGESGHEHKEGEHNAHASEQHNDHDDHKKNDTEE